jgi:hypothetical protein
MQSLRQPTVEILIQLLIILFIKTHFICMIDRYLDLISTQKHIKSAGLVLTNYIVWLVSYHWLILFAININMDDIRNHAEIAQVNFAHYCND